jgi:hypothetical protein
MHQLWELKKYQGCLNFTGFFELWDVSINVALHDLKSAFIPVMFAVLKTSNSARALTRFSPGSFDLNTVQVPLEIPQEVAVSQEVTQENTKRANPILILAQTHIQTQTQTQILILAQTHIQTQTQTQTLTLIFILAQTLIPILAQTQTQTQTLILILILA